MPDSLCDYIGGFLVRAEVIESLDDLFGWLVERLSPGPSHVIAQSMGGVLAVRLAIEQPERVARLVLVATSGGVDVARLGAAEWRDEYAAILPDVPTWFADDRTDLTDRLAEIRAPTLLVWSDADPIAALTGLWSVYAPQIDDYVRRAVNPGEAPSFGVPGNP